MKTYEQLMKHYWGVIVPMAETAGINPWECVRANGEKYTEHPNFSMYPAHYYTFALTVLEGKPLFVGDRVYAKEDDKVVVYKKELIIEGYSVSNLGNVSLMVKYAIVDRDFEMFTGRWIDLKKVTWTPPTKKRTFMLGDKELPCPVKKGEGEFLTRIAMNEFYFTNYDDRNLIDEALYQIFTSARDKE